MIFHGTIRVSGTLFSIHCIRRDCNNMFVNCLCRFAHSWNLGEKCSSKFAIGEGLGEVDTILQKAHTGFNINSGPRPLSCHPKFTDTDPTVPCDFSQSKTDWNGLMAIQFISS